MRYLNLRIPIPDPEGLLHLQSWLPSRGNVLFTLVVVAGLLWASNAGALPQSLISSNQSLSTGTIAYQGRLADSAGTPITDTVNMEFRLYDVADGGAPLWEEMWTGANAVRVSDGLFNVMLGSLNAIPQNVIAGNSNLWLGITVGTDDEMTPRVQLGSVPFAVQAMTVPDGSVTTVKLADGAVTSAKLNLLEGNIGIGTADPGERLHVAGNVRIDGRLYWSWPGRAIEDIESPTTPGSRWLRFRNSRNGNPDGAFAFTTHEDTGFTTLMKIQTNGNVGIGTESPGAKLDVNGDFRATGTKSAVVQASEFGRRKLYAAESPEVLFFDEGLARLKDGVARVMLDPVFLETIEGEYLVHVTPYGDASLYVSKIGEDYFVVKARNGDPNVAFAWRLSAHRKGYAGVRLEVVEDVGLSSEQELVSK